MDVESEGRSTAVVTGGLGGIGSAVVARLTGAGHRVICVDVARPGADTTGTPGPGAGAHITVDLGSAAGCTEAVTSIGALTGRVDILVHCAAAMLLQHPQQTSVADFDRVLAVNVRAPWLLTTGLVPLLVRGSGKSVVHIGSTHSQQTKVESFPYNVSKGALAALTKALAVDLGPLQIRVNAVLPGFVATSPAVAWVQRQPDPEKAWATIADASPTRRVVTPDDVAAAVMYLSSADAVGVSGTELIVDGGRQVLRA